MIEFAGLLHNLAIGTIATATSVGVGLSGGKASKMTLDAIDMQPEAQADIVKMSTIGLALIETAGIIGFITALLLLGDAPAEHQAWYVSIAECGIACAVAISGLAVSLASMLPVQQACIATARQPFFSQKILNLMLITMSIIQTPVLFAFILGLIIKTQLSGLEDLPNAVRLFATGLCIGLGSIGPSIGLARFAQVACQSLGINRTIYDKILTFTFISEAIIETPLIFAFVTSIMLALTPITSANSELAMIACLAAAFCSGMGTLATSIGSSNTASAACRQIAQTPESYNILSRASMISQALIDAAAVYALLISLLLIVIQ